MDNFNFIFFIVQFANFAILIAWPVLIFFALKRMRKTNISNELKLMLSLIIILVPILGSIAFLSQKFEAKDYIAKNNSEL